MPNDQSVLKFRVSLKGACMAPCSSHVRPTNSVNANLCVTFCSPDENVSATQCVAMDTEQNGRWVTAPCSTKLYHACQSDSNSTQLVLSNQPNTWSQQNCPPSFSFFLPVTGYQSWQLHQVALAGNATRTWINLLPKT